MELATVSKELLRKVSGAPQFRAMLIDQNAIDEEARTVRMAFSSEDEFERWFGIEILDHSPTSIRLDRYMKNGAAFLVGHDTDDMVGVIEDVDIGSDRRGRVLVRFGKSDRAEEIFQDIISGIRRHVSVGYWVHKMVLESQSDEGPDIYRVTDWEPFEVSTVPVPADPTVGIGRSAENIYPGDLPEMKEKVEMKEEIKATEVTVDVKAIEDKARQSARDQEITRISDINAVAEKHGHRAMADEHIKSGKTVDDFRMAVLEAQGKATVVSDSPEIGLTNKEAGSYSFVKAIHALANPGDAKAQESAAFEMDCSRAAESKSGVTSRGAMVPHDALTRDMTVGTDADGGYLVGTDHVGSAFIDVLRNRMMVLQMGATEMSGLVGNVAIPKMSASHTAYWVAEDGAPTESKATMAQMALSPKTIAAWSDLSRLLTIQSDPTVESMVRNDLAAVLGIGIDLAALHGTGASNQPTGIAATSGIGSVVGGTDGVAPSWSHIVKLETEVAQDNADIGSLGYLVNAKTRGKLRQTFANTTGGDTPLFTTGTEPGFGMLNGYKAGVTNQVSSTLTKGSSSGVASAIFFGNWADLVIAMWGGLDLMVDPYTLSTTGQLRVTAFQSVDIGIRNAQSFAAMLDALTA